MLTLRPLLLSIAYRMLGSFGDAEDVVQEAYLRLHREPAEVDSPKAFLTTVTTRLAIDQLRSARRQRESYFGPWLPEPAVDEYVDLADRAAMSDSLSTAFLVVLERLSPDQRAVFLLHDVFAYDYDEVASILAKSQSACRQIAVRARRRCRRTGRGSTLRGRSGTSWRGGSWRPAGGRTGGACWRCWRPRQPSRATVAGRETGCRDRCTARSGSRGWRLGSFAKAHRFGIRAETVHVGGHPALRMRDVDNHTVAVWSLLIADGVIVAIHGVVNPDKLTHLQN